MSLAYKIKCIEELADGTPIRARTLIIPCVTSWRADDDPAYEQNRSISRALSYTGIPFGVDKFACNGASPVGALPDPGNVLSLAGLPSSGTLNLDHITTPRTRRFILNRSKDMYIEEVAEHTTDETHSDHYYVTYNFYKNDNLYATFPSGPISNTYNPGTGMIAVTGIPFPSLVENKLIYFVAGAGFEFVGGPVTTPNKWFCVSAYAGAAGSAANWNSYLDWLYADPEHTDLDYDPEEYDTDNPYGDGGYSGETGDTPGGESEGNFSENSDDPEADDLPTIDAVGTGMATLFVPDKGQLRHLSELFWNSNVFTFLQNLVENITNMFVSLAMVPFQVQSGATVSVTWLGIDTAVSLTLAAKQFYEFDMGTINLANDERIFTSGSALDYSPFSSLGIYLPFIGYRELDIDECRGASINLRYRVDILSGSCVAILKVGGRDIYEFSGNCLTQIPITNENMQSLVSDAVNVGLAIANAEAAGAVASGAEADAIAAGEPLTEEKGAHLDQMIGRSRGQLASATANAAMGMKPNFAKTGAVSGSVAMMAVKQPYLFLKTPRQSMPEHYQRYCGFPSNITGRLNEFSGYTVVEDIRLNGLVATSSEVAEIYKLLKSGVII